MRGTLKRGVYDNFNYLTGADRHREDTHLMGAYDNGRMQFARAYGGEGAHEMGAYDNNTANGSLKLTDEGTTILVPMINSKIYAFLNCISKNSFGNSILLNEHI